MNGTVYALGIGFAISLLLGCESATDSAPSPPPAPVPAVAVSQPQPAAKDEAKPAERPEFVWIEGEAPASVNVKMNNAGWGNKTFLSGETWPHLSIDKEKVAKDLPADGALLRYDFDTRKPGTFEVWGRIGFEFVRSPFDWRIDGGEWKTSTPDELTTDLMEIDFFCEVAWLKLGDRELKPGKHAIEIRLAHHKDKKGEEERILFALDALCLNAGPFHPNGPFQPGEDGRNDRDREAAEDGLPRSRAGRRRPARSVPLKGLWEICRDDEQLPGPVAEPIKELPKVTNWRAIAVPGDKNTLRPDLVFAHRVWYRTRIDVPAGAARGGRSSWFSRRTI